MSIKPRDQWDRDDRLDYLDGWHEASGLGFKSSRDRDRVIAWADEHGSRHRCTSGDLMQLGRDAYNAREVG
jgi:hypothetical protein